MVVASLFVVLAWGDAKPPLGGGDLNSSFGCTIKKPTFPVDEGRKYYGRNSSSRRRSRLPADDRPAPAGIASLTQLRRGNEPAAGATEMDAANWKRRLGYEELESLTHLNVFTHCLDPNDAALTFDDGITP